MRSFRALGGGRNPPHKGKLKLNPPLLLTSSALRDIGTFLRDTPLPVGPNRVVEASWSYGMVFGVWVFSVSLVVRGLGFSDFRMDTSGLGLSGCVQSHVYCTLVLSIVCPEACPLTQSQRRFHDKIDQPTGGLNLKSLQT